MYNEITVQNISVNDGSDVNESHFFITINSNKYVDNLDFGSFLDWEHTTKLLIEKHLATNEELSNVIDFLDGKDIDSILSTDIEYATEIGHKYHRYHVHIYMKITHTSHIRINKENLKKLFADYWGRFGVTNPYINIRALYSAKNLRDYMGKDLNSFLYNRRSDAKNNNLS